MRLVTSVPSLDSDILRVLEPLLVAGFASPHKQIVSDTIVFWNAKFGQQASLDYPATLESVLRARVADVDIDLPTFPDSNADHVPATLPEFFVADSQHTNLAPADGETLPKAKMNDLARGSKSQYFTANDSPANTAARIPSTAEQRSSASGSSTPKARLRHDDSQIQFAPIDSSPIRFNDDSQHLTEHQLEVKARQHEAAQMFPELSSSPMAQSTALPRAFPKRLDFSDPRVEEEDNLGTPTALREAGGLMSDDMPSSPTPSSTKDAGQAKLESDDDQATEDEMDEPSSSPPRVPSGGKTEHTTASGQGEVDETAAGATDYAFPIADAARGEAEAVRHHTVSQNDEDDITSDSILPTEQLQWEAEAAESASQTIKDNAVKSEGHAAQVKTDAVANEISRVEDSFLGNAQDHAGVEDEATETPGSRRSSRKRKRASSIEPTSKKQKSASPLKRFISRIWPTSQQDDDDIGEEIVVASSQRSQSPTSRRVADLTVSASQPVDESTADVTEIKEEAMAPPLKRRPGRPRKSATPTSSLSQSNEDVPQTRSLKRKASAISNASAVEDEITTSFVKDTPSAWSGRKGRKGHAASQSRGVLSSQTNSQSDRVMRRTATAVMASPPRVGNEDEEYAAEGAAEADVEVATAQKSGPQDGNAAAVEARPKLTPKSILGRLRDALSDLVGIRMNSAEVREFDDVLFEIRREAHEAEFRGRGE